jgi:hypothetical protein
MDGGWLRLDFEAECDSRFVGLKSALAFWAVDIWINSGLELTTKNGLRFGGF